MRYIHLVGGDETRRLGTQANVIIPETGAAKYWYVDPRAMQTGHEDQGDAMLEAFKRLLEGSQAYQPKASEGQYQF